MDWLWNWGGKCFGYREGDSLFTYFGKEIGRFDGEDSTARKYKLLNRQMEEFAQRRGLRVLADFDLSSIVRSWQARLRKLFKLANVSEWTCHRFRDTFAVELLLAGVPIEESRFC